MIEALCLLSKPREQQQEAIYFVVAVSVNFRVCGTLEYRFVFEEESRSGDHVDPALKDEVQDATARALAAAEGFDEDGGVEDDAHRRRLSHSCAPTRAQRMRVNSD